MKKFLKYAGIAFLALVVLIVLVSVVGGGGSKSTTDNHGQTVSSNSNHDPKNDVKITECSIKDKLLGPEATVTVLNHSSKPSDYLVNVAFESADGATQYGTGVAMVNDLNHGQTGSDTAIIMDPPDNIGKFTCRVVSVDRMASTN